MTRSSSRQASRAAGSCSACSRCRPGPPGAGRPDRNPALGLLRQIRDRHPAGQPGRADHRSAGVAAPRRHRLRGNNPGVVSSLRLLSCPRQLGAWNAYAGGFDLRSPSGCVPLVFHIGRQTATLSSPSAAAAAAQQPGEPYRRSGPGGGREHAAEPGRPPPAPEQAACMQATGPLRAGTGRFPDRQPGDTLQRSTSGPPAR